MYCIKTIDYGYADDYYVGYQDDNTGMEAPYNYLLISKEEYLLNLPNHDRKKHPTYFKTREAAEKFIKYLKQFDTIVSSQYLEAEWISNRYFPVCGFECQKCNKKNKFHCKNLRNPYQNICGFKMARFKEDQIKIDPKRLDAPCESCLNQGCLYWQGARDK